MERPIEPPLWNLTKTPPEPMKRDRSTMDTTTTQTVSKQEHRWGYGAFWGRNASLKSFYPIPDWLHIFPGSLTVLFQKMNRVVDETTDRNHSAVGQQWLVASVIDASFPETQKFEEVRSFLRLTNTTLWKLARAITLGPSIVCVFRVFEGSQCTLT